MEALIGWLAFTVKEYEGKKAKAEEVIIDILELDPAIFQLLNGRIGYRQQYFYNNIRVYFDARENMEIHVQISGEGIRYLEAKQGFKWKDIFYMLINRILSLQVDF